ncbi:MAG: hypothetical protein IJ608_01780 [Lachnospiraceae bacterium]|nr:hypothetical protein [Lachnospiraceae bacterium]
MNSETEIKLRHYKNTLSIGGKCYIILGFWAVIKTILQLVLGEESINRKSVSGTILPHLTIPIKGCTRTAFIREMRNRL